MIVNGDSLPLDRSSLSSTYPAPHLLAPEIKQTFLSDHHASLLAFEWQQLHHVSLTPNGRLHSHAVSWVFLSRTASHDYTPRQLQGALCAANWHTSLHPCSSKTICFGVPPYFSPAHHWLSTNALPFWNGNTHLGMLTALRQSKSTVCPQTHFSFEHKVLSGHFANCFWHVCLRLRLDCEHKVLFGHLSSWFWCVSDIEDHLWALSVISFCQLVLECVCHHRSSALSKCLGFHVWNPLVGLVTVLSSGVWVYISFVWLVSLLPFVKWETQVSVQFSSVAQSCSVQSLSHVQFIRKTLPMRLWIKEKKNNF